MDNQHTEQCNVHGSELDSTVVSVEYLKRPAKAHARAYLAAHEALFPNCDDPLHHKNVDSSTRRPLLVQRPVCFQCNFARDEWLDSQAKSSGVAGKQAVDQL